MRKAFVLLCFFCALTGYAQTSTEQEAVRYFNSGVKHYNAGSRDRTNYDRAVRDFTQAIYFNPNAWLYYNWRGAAYYKCGDYNRAIEDFTQAIRLNPTEAVNYDWRGYVYSNRWARPLVGEEYYGANPRWKEDMAKAVADFEAALRLDPNSVNAQREIERVRERALGGPPLLLLGPLSDIFGDKLLPEEPR
jgi:tetratricopeptide (TPR) repeat protein